MINHYSETLISNTASGKAQPGETYAEVIERLIELCIEEEELNPEEWTWIEQAEAEYKAGKTYTLIELKRRLGDE